MDDAVNDQMRRTWGRMAQGWASRAERTDASMRVVSDWLVDRAAPRPGDVILDVAAGPGGLGHRAAALVKPDGGAISTDFAVEMVEAARRLGVAQGLDNVRYRTLDAQDMDLDDDSVDAVLCRSGYMLMPDPAAAFAETRRVLRPGGRLAFSVFAEAAANPHVRAPVRTFVELGHMPPPEPGGPGLFSMDDPSRIRELVTAASFAAPEIELLDFAFHYADDDEAWNTIIDINGRLSPIITALDDDERNATRRAVMDGFAPYRGGDGSYRVPAQVWVAHAR